VRNARGFTLLELLIVIAVLGILLSFALAGYRYARVRGAEAAAIAALEAINQAQFAYMQTCGHQMYAPTLSSLGTPAPGSGAPYLSPDLTQSDELVKSGYLIKMAGTEAQDAPQTCTSVVPVSGYQITADPTSPGITGTRFFGTNTDRVIFADTGTFTGNMPETGAPPHGSELK
jgi:prepilin-type N-terminal cleavage/methylation domain-containing protein